MRENKGFSLVEVLVAGAILVMVFAAAIEASILLRDVCYVSIAAHNLQRDVNLVMDYIVKRGPSENTYNGLRSAVSYTIPVTNSSGSEIQFRDLNIGNLRRYYLSGNTIWYESPTTSPSSSSWPIAVYTVPSGAAIKLQFWPASEDNETVGVYIAITQTVSGKPVSGSLSTYVNLRNLAK